MASAGSLIPSGRPTPSPFMRSSTRASAGAAKDDTDATSAGRATRGATEATEAFAGDEEDEEARTTQCLRAEIAETGARTLERRVDIIVAWKADLDSAFDKPVAQLAMVRRIADSQGAARPMIGVRTPLLIFGTLRFDDALRRPPDLIGLVAGALLGFPIVALVVR